MDSKPFPTEWYGWTFWESYLVDPQGNRYSPDMVRTSLYTMELAHELRGSPTQIRSLKAELKKRLQTPLPEIMISWNGEDMRIPIPRIIRTNTPYPTP